MLHGGTILNDNLQNITGSIYDKSLCVQDLIKRTLSNAYSSVIFTNLVPRRTNTSFKSRP